MIRVDTPGVTTADVTRLAFQNRRRPMFPFEGETEWEG
jgi:microcystin degradation protein MlrC